MSKNSIEFAAGLLDEQVRAGAVQPLSGRQALVRLPMLQQVRDARAGWHTAGLVAGCPEGPQDVHWQALWHEQGRLAAHRIVLQPCLRDDMAATAVWGTQQLEFEPAARRFDGVFGVWCCTEAGVDRSIDAIKHANMAGTAPKGGVVAVTMGAGDAAAAAAFPCAHLFEACGIPVLVPADAQEVLDLGLHAIAMSRHAGVWAALRVTQSVADAVVQVDHDPARVPVVWPGQGVLPEGGVHIRWPDDRLAQEARLAYDKALAVQAYVRANRLDRCVIDAAGARLGIMAAGEDYHDTRRALAALGLDAAACRQLGVRLYKVAVAWPLEPSLARTFATGLRHILVVEDTRPVIEGQLKALLYDAAAGGGPAVQGLRDAAMQEGRRRPGLACEALDPLLPRPAQARSARVALAIACRLLDLGVPGEVEHHLRRCLDTLAADAPWPSDRPVTAVPVEPGSLPGSEGVAWVGQAPFSARPRGTARLDEATYRQAGLLAIRQAIAAQVDITYRLVCPDGGHVEAIVRELCAEGVARIAIVGDASAWRGGGNATVHPRGELDTVHRELQERRGCSVLILLQPDAGPTAPASPAQATPRRSPGTLVRWCVQAGERMLASLRLGALLGRLRRSPALGALSRSAGPAGCRAGSWSRSPRSTCASTTATRSLRASSSARPR